MQRLVSDVSSMLYLQQKVNELLAEGWRIVPGSVGCGSTQRAARSVNEFADKTPAGVVHESHFWAVVEKDEQA